MDSIRQVAVSIVMIGLITACVNAQTISKVDLSTDEAVLAELQKRADANHIKLGLINKKSPKIEAQNVCIERLKESVKVIVIGFFAYDVGCRFGGAFVDSRFYEKDDAALSKNALATFVWEKAPKGEREMLASYWVQKGLLAFFTVLQMKDKDLNAVDFHPPRAVSTKDRGVTVRLWVQLPSGMRREKGFQHFEFKFAKDGSLSGSSTLEN